jgi:hypothetical protein
MEDDGLFDVSVEKRSARIHEKFLRDIITTTRALLKNVEEHRIAISIDQKKCKRDFHQLVERLEYEVREWQNFAVTFKIPQDHAHYTEAMQHFKGLYLKLKDDRRKKHENHEKMMADCVETAKPLLRLYDSHRRLLLAEEQHVPFDARVPDNDLDYFELENLADTHMWRLPI